MSVRPVPITWPTTGQLTKAQLDANVRDPVNWIYAALDLITETTASDTGNATHIRIYRGAAANAAFSSRVTGDTQNRFGVTAAGSMDWGPGGGTAPDTSQARTGVGELTFASTRLIPNSITPTSTTDAIRIPNGYIEMVERATDPAAPANNEARIWVKDNGAGKSQLMVRFSGGQPQILATMP